MKFLITGAYGFVGTNLCKYLVSKGHVCDALDIAAAQRNDVPYRQFFTWDDLSASHLPPLTSHLSSYDAVVHLAGKAHDLKKVASEKSYFDVNVGLTQRIFNALREDVCHQSLVDSKLPTFIYFSSCKAVEQDTPYAKSKWAAEQWLLSTFNLQPSTSNLQPSTSSINVIILRPAMIYGPGNKGNLNLLWSVVKHGIPWPLAAFENQRSFTSIGNVCAAVEALALRSSRNAHHAADTYFICDDDGVSTNRIIELMAEARGKRARLWRLPKGLMRAVARLGDIFHLPLNTERLEKLTEDCQVDNSEIKKALGWKNFPIFVEDGMRETFKSFAISAIRG